MCLQIHPTSRTIDIMMLALLTPTLANVSANDWSSRVNLLCYVQQRME